MCVVNLRKPNSSTHSYIHCPSPPPHQLLANRRAVESPHSWPSALVVVVVRFVSPSSEEGTTMKKGDRQHSYIVASHRLERTRSPGSHTHTSNSHHVYINLSIGKLVALRLRCLPHCLLYDCCCCCRRQSLVKWPNSPIDDCSRVH